MMMMLFAACQSNDNSSPEKGRTGDFKLISPKEIPGNVFEMIGDQWMLITGGKEENYNTMTASWGNLGVLWGKPISTCYIRPSRHTLGFMEDNEYYTLCFFDEQHRDALTFCGTKSGRDFKEKNKAEEAGLTPLTTANGAVYFKEAYLVIECKKLYSQQFNNDSFVPEFVAENVGTGEKQIYPDASDYHIFFIGEIVNCYYR